MKYVLWSFKLGLKTYFFLIRESDCKLFGQSEVCFLANQKTSYLMQ